MAFGPDGNLHVAARDGIHRFSGQDGAHLGVFVPAAGPPSSAALLFVPDVPRLQISFRSDLVEVSWPAGAGAWRLLSNTSGAKETWMPVTNSPTRLHSKNVVTVPSATGSTFFRLQRQRGSRLVDHADAFEPAESPQIFR
jgi:hypothetical protein